MKPVDAAWLAGFFDGEGSIIKHKGGANRKSAVWKLYIANTNLESLEKVQRITGCGRVTVKKIEPGNRKPQWVWQAHGKRDIKSLLEQMSPYLTVKLEAAQNFADNYTEWGKTV